MNSRLTLLEEKRKLKDRPLTTEELEFEEMMSFKKFKARPLNKKILEEGNLGLAHVDRMLPTQFDEFNLSARYPKE